MMPPVRTRFAPSPTGRLHRGHGFSALLAHHLAFATGGNFLLRHEDLDRNRVREEYVGAIENDLTWVGIEWDSAPIRQSEREDAYATALDHLRTAGLIYPCFCTRKEIQRELARISAAPHGGDAGGYPGTCRRMNPARAQAKMAVGEEHSWRLDATAALAMAGPNLEFHDLRLGTFEIDPQFIPDPILARKDIGSSYHLAVVVDDAASGITHVTRGEDLLEATHVHRLLQAALKLPVPLYLHHRLVLDADGKRLAKRDDAESLQSLRETGLTPEDFRAEFAADLAAVLDLVR